MEQLEVQRRIIIMVQKKKNRRMLFPCWLVGLFVSLLFVALVSSVPGCSATEAVCTTEGECTTTNDNNEEDDWLSRRHLLEVELEIAPTKECKDNHEKCEAWSNVGECVKNPKYMLVNCQKSCNKCPPGSNPNILLHKNQWGEPQEVLRGDEMKNNDMKVLNYNDTKILDMLAQTQDYMLSKVYVDPEFTNVKDGCQNAHKSCTFWASVGECEANEKYMKKSCAPACLTCELLDYNKRCPTDSLEVLRQRSAWKQPGDIDAMFMDILQNQQQYQPVVYSKPRHVQVEIRPDTNETIATILENVPDKGPPIQYKTITNQLGDSIIQDGPWVVTLENFLTEQECDTLVQLGFNIGYERSADVGKKKADGTYDRFENPGRTSTTAWCSGDPCYFNTTTQTILEKMSNVTKIPDTNAEYIQLLKYEKTQFYQQHHDYIKYQFDRSYGPRILTLFMYLNNVDAGGGTDFPKLGLTVMPKKGKALLWPSVLNDEPDRKDHRTDHQALPVEEGIKFGANAWFHSRDFKDAYTRGCI